MKVQEPNLSPAASTGISGPQGTPRTSSGSGAGVGSAGDAGSSDGVHLSELVRSLRSLAADSPQHQDRMEQIARSVGNGSYSVDTQGTASQIVNDALQRN